MSPTEPPQFDLDSGKCEDGEKTGKRRAAKVRGKWVKRMVL